MVRHRRGRAAQRCPRSGTRQPSIISLGLFERLVSVRRPLGGTVDLSEAGA